MPDNIHDTHDAPHDQFFSATRFDRRDDWMAYDITNGRDDARFLGMIPAVFADPKAGPIFGDGVGSEWRASR